MRRSLVLPLVGACALSTFGGAIAATGPPDDPTSAEALSAAAERSATSAQRFEMYFELTGLFEISDDAPLAVGEFDGKQYYMHMDLGSVLGPMLEGPDAPPGFDAEDLTMEMTISGTNLYLRAPFFAVIAEQLGPQAGPLTVFAELGEGWGYIDLAQLEGVAPDDVADSLGGLGGGLPAQYLDLLLDVAKPVPLGTEVIHGVESSGMTVNVDFAELMEAQGGTLDQLGEEAAALEGLTIPIEVWLGDGYVRRFVMRLDGETFAEVAEQAGEDSSDLDMMNGIEMTMRMEMFDYADPSIRVETPTATTDITDEFGELIELGRQT